MAATSWGRFVANVANVLAPNAVAETAGRGQLPQQRQPSPGRLKYDRRRIALAGAERRRAGLKPGATRPTPQTETGAALPLLLALGVGGVGLAALAAKRRR